MGARHPALAATLAVAMILAAVAGFLGYQAYSGEQKRLAETKEKKEAQEKLLAEQRQNALDKAMVAAMSQDWDAAERSVAEAQRLGAADGQVYLVRGFIANYHGKSADAVKQLEQAVALHAKERRRPGPACEGVRV